MDSLAQCRRHECPECERIVGGCACGEAIITPMFCVTCREEKAYRMTIRMRELNERLDALGVIYHPSKEDEDE